MGNPPLRQTVELSQYPELVVIYLGMRANSLNGVRTLFGFGRRIRQAVEEDPEGLLHHNFLTYSLVPPHVGIRQYWRDFESLEAWARSRDSPHSSWWQEFLSDPAGTGFWHETYLSDGTVEAVYDDMEDHPVGLMQFAPICPASGRMFSARDRLDRKGNPEVNSPVSEADLERDRPE